MRPFDFRSPVPPFMRRAAVRLFWRRAHSAGGIHTWMHDASVRRYINASVTGDPDRWPMEWFQSRFAKAPFAVGMSFGCGDGALERDVRRKEICRSIVGTDVSETALEGARREAAAEQLSGIEYRRMDFNDLRLAPGSIDIAFFHQALHHCDRLEACLAAIFRALKPSGILYLDEYIGPSRHEWRRALLESANAVYREISRPARRRSNLQIPVDWRDPSEAIRSSEIHGALASRFEIIERRDYGGNFLAVIFPHLDLTRVSGDEAREIVGRIIDAERRERDAGAPSFNAVIVARRV